MSSTYVRSDGSCGINDTNDYDSANEMNENFYIASDVDCSKKHITGQFLSENKEETANLGMSPNHTLCDRFQHFYKSESLLIEVATVIFLAYLNPPIGEIYIAPEITAHWIAVMIIFFISGFSLNFNELAHSVKSNVRFNAFVTCYNFFFISLAVHFVAVYFYNNDLVSEDLMKGMIICSCLPMPTNMLLVLVTAAGGDDANALFLATTVNLVGVFLTPLMIIMYLGEKSEFDFVSAIESLCLRVLLPVIVGICMKYNIDGATTFCKEKTDLFGMIRQRCLVFIVYATFCHTFYEEKESSSAQFLIMASAQIILFVSAQVVAWLLLFILFNKNPKLRVTGLYACTLKTAALGIPLITAIYTDHPKLGMYTMPLLVWYPTQLIFGTIISSRLKRFVDYKLSKEGEVNSMFECTG